MKKRICPGITIIFIFLSCIYTEVYGGVYLTRREALEMVFPGADRIEKKVVLIGDKEKRDIKKLVNLNKITRFFTYYEGIKKGKSMGYATIRTTWSKSGRIVYILVVDIKGAVISVDILEYHGMYGSGIKDKKFLQQFKGKTVNDQIKIDVVTGATISSNVLAKAIKESLAYFQILGIFP